MTTTTSSTKASTNSSAIVKALGAGSGIDVQALAQSLVDAERAPQKELIDAKITRTEARISGYGALKYALGELRTAFEKLNDATDFGAPKIGFSQPGALTATASGAAATGSYSVEVTQLARPQRLATSGFATASTSLNNGQAFSLSLSVNGAAAQAINVTTPTPAGLVSAINAAGLGVSAQLLNTGDASTPYSVVVTGQDGAAKAFTLTSPVAGVSFSNTLTTAADARLTVNGLQVTRPSNVISDVIPDVTLNLSTTTSGAARLDLTRDTQTAKESIRGLVTAYNNFEESLKVLGDSKSEVETLGGSLAGDSLLRTIRSQIRSVLTGNSSSASGSVRAARDVGLSLDRYGKLTLDESRLDTALASNFSDVAKMFSAGTSNKSLYSAESAGVAGDMVVAIDKLQRSTGLIASQTDNANKELTRNKAKLEALQSRMEKLLARYQEQFGAMESVVGNTNSLRTSLTSTFEGMMSAYTR